MKTPQQMNTQQPLKAPAVLGGVLQRKCACGQHTFAGAECDSCSKKKLHRSASDQSKPAEIPPLVHDTLRQPGQALDRETRTFMEKHLAHDFSNVRVHTDSRAAESAESVNALAYTVGRQIVFGSGRYAPQTTAGKQLLAHELTHVVQQRGMAASGLPDTISDAHEPMEREADTIAQQVSAGHAAQPHARGQNTLLRVVKVENPDKLIPNPTGKGVKQTNAATVSEQFGQLCSGETPKIDEKSGVASLSGAFCSVPGFQIGHEVLPAGPMPAEEAKTATGCTCLCDLINGKNEWIVRVDDVSRPHTTFKDDEAARGKKPGGTGGVVTTLSPNSPKIFGSISAAGKKVDYDPWLILGHELCGHGWLGNQGKAESEKMIMTEGRQPLTVDRENALRAEHQMEARGRSFRDPFCGESYERFKAGKTGTETFDPGAMDHCTRLRARCRKPDKKLFKIEERIPDDASCKL